MPSGYARDVGDPSQIKKNKQSMADLKLRRLTELNNRLREDLERERIPVSQASKRYWTFSLFMLLCEPVTNSLLSIISYTNSTKDFMVPSVWGTVDKVRYPPFGSLSCPQPKLIHWSQKDDPYAPQQNGGCCAVM